MQKKGSFCILLILALLITGCINFEVEHEDQSRSLLEIVLITYTPVQPSITQTKRVSGGDNPNVTAIPTETVSLPTDTPSPTVTSVRLNLFSTSTITPTATQSRIEGVVGLNSNCRSGPGTDYQIIDYLSQGDTVLVIGRLFDNSWWVVKKDDSAVPCWAIASAVIFDVAPEILPTVSPPPAPTATYHPWETPTNTKEPREPTNKTNTPPSPSPHTTTSPPTTEIPATEPVTSPTTEVPTTQPVTSPTTQVPTTEPVTSPTTQVPTTQPPPPVTDTPKPPTETPQPPTETP